MGAASRPRGSLWKGYVRREKRMKSASWMSLIYVKSSPASLWQTKSTQGILNRAKFFDKWLVIWRAHFIFKNQLNEVWLKARLFDKSYTFHDLLWKVIFVLYMICLWGSSFDLFRISVSNRLFYIYQRCSTLESQSSFDFYLMTFVLYGALWIWLRERSRSLFLKSSPRGRVNKKNIYSSS